MERKGISLSIVLAIIAIIVIGVIAITFAVKDNTNRKKSADEGAKTAVEAGKIDDETNEKSSSKTNSNDDKEEENKLTQIDGAFSFGASDLIYIFNSDGTVEKGTNLSSSEGKYEINDKNEIKVTFDKETVYDMDSGKTKINNINEVEKFTYIDNDTLRYSNGEDMTRLEMN